MNIYRRCQNYWWELVQVYLWDFEDWKSKSLLFFPPWKVNQEHMYSTPREYYNCEYEAAKVFNWFKLSNYSIDIYIYSHDEINKSPTDFEEININDIKISENLNINSEFLNKYLDFWKAKLDKELENDCYILNIKLLQKNKISCRILLKIFCKLDFYNNKSCLKWSLFRKEWSNYIMQVFR